MFILGDVNDLGGDFQSNVSLNIFLSLTNRAFQIQAIISNLLAVCIYAESLASIPIVFDKDVPGV